MSKTTNKQQSQHLLTLMEASPDIARGFFKGNREVLARFWRKAEDELNSMGPPIKCIAEWKKVWADQKKYVRQKASQNLKDRKSTGGGPSKEQKLSSTEEAIYNLIGMQASVEGVAVKSFGLSSSEAKEITASIDADFHYLDDVPDNEMSIEEITPLTTGPTKLKFPNNKKLEEKKDRNENAQSVLQAELQIQRELLDNIKFVVANQKEQEQATRKIYRSLDRMNDQQKKHFAEMEKLKREEIKEMRRHHLFMEKLRVQEVEYKLEKNRLQMEIDEYTS